MKLFALASLIFAFALTSHAAPVADAEMEARALVPKEASPADQGIRHMCQRGAGGSSSYTCF